MLPLFLIRKISFFLPQCRSRRIPSLDPPRYRFQHHSSRCKSTLASYIRSMDGLLHRSLRPRRASWRAPTKRLHRRSHGAPPMPADWLIGFVRQFAQYRHSDEFKFDTETESIEARKKLPHHHNLYCNTKPNAAICLGDTAANTNLLSHRIRLQGSRKQPPLLHCEYRRRLQITSLSGYQMPIVLFSSRCHSTRQRAKS